MTRLLCCLLLTGCCYGPNALLWRSEATYHPNGTYHISSGPDREAIGTIVGGATSVYTNSIWPAVALSVPQATGELVRAPARMADNITTQGR